MNSDATKYSLLWEELTATQISTIARLDRSVAVVPVAAIEQHGPHLPTGTDTYLANAVCYAAAQRCRDVSTPVVVTPCLWLGRSFHHTDLGGTLSSRLDTITRCIEDVSASIFEAGFVRQIFVNGHGGNAAALDAVVQEIGARGKVRPMAVTYFNLAREVVSKTRRSPVGGMGHACEFETALMQYLHPELVGEIKAGEPRPLLHSALRRDMFAAGDASIYQNFSELSNSGAVGLPQYADKENGKLWFEACSQRLADMIVEYSTLTWP